MVESLVDWFTSVFADLLPGELVIFLLSMLPILELRGGLIAAALLDIPLVEAVCICFIGNLIPVPFILLLIRPIFAWLKRTALFRPFVEKLERKAMGKSDTIRRYEFWGLLIFVGIPLPGTGVWTGALIASMLNISIKKSHASAGVGDGHGYNHHVFCFLLFALAADPILVMVAVVMIAGNLVVGQFMAQPSFCYLANRTGAAADNFNAVGVQHIFSAVAHVAA